ncbi:Serine-threonine protein kinase [Apiospora arundinis]
MDKVGKDTGQSLPAVPQPEAPLPSTDIPEDLEEGGESYRPGGFHPVYISDVYHTKYKVLSKLGYGRYPTVWLVRDLKAQEGDPNEFYALKVLSAECYGSEKDIFEREESCDT